MFLVFTANLPLLSFRVTVAGKVPSAIVNVQSNSLPPSSFSRLGQLAALIGLGLFSDKVLMIEASIDFVASVLLPSAAGEAEGLEAAGVGEAERVGLGEAERVGLGEAEATGLGEVGAVAVGLEQLGRLTATKQNKARLGRISGRRAEKPKH